MKIEEFLGTLPQGIISGEDIQLTDSSLRDIFEFVNLSENDVFYHLGCGNGNGIKIALEEFKVKKAIGIDNDRKKIEQAKKAMIEKNLNAELFYQDIVSSEFNDATVILFWFTNPVLVDKMMEKFEKLNDGCRIITIWSPLPECLPDYVDFPYIISMTPFRKTKDLQEQILSVFGVKCIDFVTSWEYAERYTKAIGSPQAGNDRFLTILQSVMIWINARNLGVTCDDEMPESIRTYIGILRTFFNIEVEHLLLEK